jgi:hypothetical protein
MRDVVDVDDVIRSINGIEKPPFPHGVFAQDREVGADGLMTQVVRVGGYPFGLVKYPLSHRLVNARQVLYHRRPKCELIPRHTIVTSEVRGAGRFLRQTGAQNSAKRL